MEKNRSWPTLVFGTSDQAANRRIQQARRSGQLREVAPRIYSPDLTTSPDELIANHWLPVIEHLYPGAVVSHRSGLEVRPTADGHLFLTYGYTRNIALPGLTVHLLTGPAAQPEDLPFGAGRLHFASEARALLENLQPARVRAGGISKVLPATEVEERLEVILRVRGEDGLNALRDQARLVAERVGWEAEYAVLHQLISALLTTSPAHLLTSPVARARALGLPYDPARVALFTNLLSELRRTVLPDRPDPAPNPPAYYHVAFFEAYFSNFIEGTEFEVDEAHRIIESGQPVAGGRHADSHDILSTYQLCSRSAEMSVVPASADELLTLLQQRHAALMTGRLDKRPGQWKERANKAGNTTFVEPELVRGTLHQAFKLYQALDHPLARAIFLMFVISEVHPFDDGNGRIARLMMNAELVKGGLSRIIITTSYRQDYLDALRLLSRRHEPTRYVQMLTHAQGYVAGLATDSYQILKAQFVADHAFEERRDGLFW